MTMITLLTDFGTRDGYVGVMRGVIWGIAPEVRVADLSHEIGAQNVLEAALTLGRSFHFFPAGTIHLAVIDPGVGTSRRPIAAAIGPYYFVGPDNGLFTPMLERAEAINWAVKVVKLDQPRYWLPEVSKSFHGRDIFAPVAAHLAAGVPLESLGTLIDDYVRLRIPRPVKTGQGWHSQVIQVDHFGNLATNLEKDMLLSQSVDIWINSQRISRLVQAYGDAKAGELVAMFDSANHLSICVVNSSAAELLKASAGDAVEVIYRKKTGQL
jgi:S-adenosyl-L-methionine hydrolase (adenosine-forming)